MEHKFKFDGQEITYRSGTVMDREARKIVLRKLYAACGGREHVPEIELETMWDYANHITHTSPFAADWRREAGDTGDVLYEGYTLFKQSDADVYDLFWNAILAAQPPEKKS
jgi:hypothetical protein